MLILIPLLLFCGLLNGAPLTQDEAETLGMEAYIYGYPLVTMDMTREVMTNVATPSGTKAPLGQFAHMQSHPTAALRATTAPNTDTLYSTAWLDLSKDAYVLHLPDTEGRFYLMALLSGWTEVFADPGTRTTGTAAQDLVITGPQWKGALPKGMRRINSPTNMVWIILEVQEDKAVHALQKQYTLTPLKSYGKNQKLVDGQVNASLDMMTPVREQVNGLTAQSFFARLSKLLKDNPPAKVDADLIARIAKIGIVAGADFDLKKLPPDAAMPLSRVPRLAQSRILKQEHKAGKEINGWIYTAQTGAYGTDYMQRAFVAATRLGANLPQDALYPYAKVDSKGNNLTGDKRYTIHFKKDETPPVKGFWSITLYDDHYFFAPNPLNRFTLSARDALKYNGDGSLDLYIQHTKPDGDKVSNWLPAPKGPFILMLRMYSPDEKVLDGRWKPPAIITTN